MRLLLFIIVVFAVSCKTSKLTNQANDLSYLVKKINSKNNWHIIYASKQDSLFKIIVGKETNTTYNCDKIKVGEYYNLKLHSRKSEVVEINGVRVQPVNLLDIQCYTYNKETTICIEPQKGIYDLYHAENLKGLCLVK